MKRVLYSIEGNIGSGKTTLLKLINEKMRQVEVVKEPVDGWQHIGKHNLLQKYYDDPQRWAYTFQTYAILSRMTQLRQMLQSSSPHKILFSERSVMADKFIFAKLLRKMGKMNEMEYELYLRTFADLDSLFQLPRQHRYIYLRTSPQQCLKRIKKRNRFEEKSLSLDYLQNIHELHEEWLVNSNCIQVNGEQDFQSDEKLIEAIITQLKVQIAPKQQLSLALT